ncbi:MAG: WYL domain-containing protein [Schleiferiaceae bacterium]|nr:WYL domain-containing protein [Schleiferiaceae bacterium]
MAGKNQLLRMMVLDGMLRRPEPVRMRQMIVACMQHPAMLRADSDVAISERTIRGDLRLMRDSFGAPIPKRNVEGYQYSDLSYSIFQVPLLQTELEVLQQLGSFLNQFEGFDFGNELRQIIAIGQAIPEVSQAQPSVDLGLPGNQIGNQWLRPIYKALSARTLLRITYQPFAGVKEVSNTFAPFLLKLYNRRWYVLGKSSLRPNLITNYALNRIQAVAETTGNYEIPKDFQQEHFSYIIGTTLYLNHPIMDITLDVKKPFAHYLQATPLHATQTLLEESESYIRFGLKLRENHELINTLLSLSSNLLHVTPSHLADRLRETLQLMLNQLDK